MNGNVLFSIVMPVFNVEKYIKRALCSLKNQTYDKFEVVIVDDCGQDESIKVAEEYVKNDSRFKIVYHEKNLGTFHARRTGVVECTGSYIIFLDPDDELEGHAIEFLLGQISNRPDIVFFGTRLAPPPKIWQGRSRVPILKNITNRADLVATLLNSKNFNFGTEGKLISKPLLERAYCRLNVPIDVRLVYSEDSLLFSALLIELNNATSTNNCLYIYHKNPTSITVRRDLDIMKVRAMGLQKSIKYVESFNVFSDFDKNVKSKIIKKFKVDLIKQNVKMSHGYFEVVKSYFFLAIKSKNYKNLVKLLIYIFTLRKY